MMSSCGKYRMVSTGSRPPCQELDNAPMRLHHRGARCARAVRTKRRWWSNDVLMGDVLRTHASRLVLAERLVETRFVPAGLGFDADCWGCLAPYAKGATAMNSRAAQDGAGDVATKLVESADIV